MSEAAADTRRDDGQMREAVLRMNLTTSVSDGLATLRNWRPAQRDHVVRHVYEFAGRCQMPAGISRMTPTTTSP